MAAVTTDNNYVVVLGPIKLEIAQVSSVDDGDTYVTTLQNPSFACYIETTDTNADANSVNIGISGRTLTFNNSTLSADTGVVLVFGF